MTQPLKVPSAGGVAAFRAALERRKKAGLWRRTGVALLGALVCAGLVAGCAKTITKHGQLLTNADLQQIKVGMSDAEVRAKLGTPATTTTIGSGKAIYYISSTMTQTTFSKPREIDRRVTAVYFSQTSAVTRVASYGLKDGKVFDFISRKTPSAASGDKGIINELFRNIGRRSFGGGGGGGGY